MRLLIRNIILLAGILGTSMVLAESPETSTVNGIDLTASEVTMFGQERQENLTCKVKPLGHIKNKGALKLGDTVNHAGRSIKVGIIELDRFTQDLEFGGRVLMHKGDQLCLVAEDKDALPRQGDCNALWLRVNPCKVLQ